VSDADERPDAASPDVLTVVEAMSSLVRTVDGFRHRAATAARVGMTELRALGRLHVSGALSPKQLAEALDLTTGTVTALLDRLERADLVTRIPHPRDRRMLRIELTAEGRARYGSVLATWDRHILAAAQTLPPESVPVTIAFLRELEGNITGPAEGEHATAASA
jgi:DNA-binding MarR family transcriptional regulator